MKLRLLFLAAILLASLCLPAMAYPSDQEILSTSRGILDALIPSEPSVQETGSASGLLGENLGYEITIQGYDIYGRRITPAADSDNWKDIIPIACLLLLVLALGGYGLARMRKKESVAVMPRNYPISFFWKKVSETVSGVAA